MGYFEGMGIGSRSVKVNGLGQRVCLESRCADGHPKTKEASSNEGASFVSAIPPHREATYAIFILVYHQTTNYGSSMTYCISPLASISLITSHGGTPPVGTVLP